MQRLPSLRLFNKNLQRFTNNYIKFSQTAVKEEGSVNELLSPAFTGESDKQYSQHIHNIVDQISKLTLLEVADLSDLLQSRLNIKSPVGMMPMMVQSPTQTEEVEDQPASIKSSFTVRLINFDPAKKVPLIKEIRLLLPDLSLVQVKKFVESAPGDVKCDVSKSEAEEIKKVLEEAGASIEID